ncbi:NAD(+) synthase [Candidatus Epulonipiscium fishelsonii]|uniref:NAD(+) synthase n=1 Tax=Candidatus Epulonipiscium fishelsonii TaxID=77094 RepID=A0ACC8XDS7_9FIRM|nr:NAD(+) synthase [Epulopiscium sp. SCG-B11WGA-EpuloA1]ONI42158.1 NAD(+) synthase [Epulopiscium sp. SCG-B05WGA-EpuloA1]
MDFKLEERINWVKERVTLANASGVVIGASGGKDSSTVIALCTKALGAENVLAVSMPCSSLITDMEHAKLVTNTFGVELLVINLENTFNAMKQEINPLVALNDLAIANIKPRLRMTTLYSIAQTKNYLVAGTDNLSEMVMGYFTKWGDGAYDFNPLGDLTMHEVLGFGRALGVPSPILEKPPSAGLWEGQTDEQEMGVTYREIEEYIKTGITSPSALEIILRINKNTNHKREMPYIFKS